MRIAMTMPLYAIGVDGAAGISNSVGLLTKHLSDRGHDVDVYTVATSRLPAGTRIDVLPKGIIELGRTPADAWAWDAAGMIKVAKMVARERYDIIHNNCCSYTGYLELSPLPHCLTTLRLPADWGGFPSACIAFEIDPSIKSSAFAAVSDNQRRAYAGVNFLATVHNGIELDGFHFNDDADDYVAWLGRLDTTKGLDHAAAACERTGTPFRFAGSKREPAVYELALELAKKKNVEFVGYANPEVRDALLGRARALLTPSRWEEPFGYVNVESMACGTPVIAYDLGANREVIEHGVTGFIIPPGDQDGFAAALQKIMSMPAAEYRAMRRACRERVEKLFTVDRVVDDYERLYAQVLGRPAPGR